MKLPVFLLLFFFCLGYSNYAGYKAGGNNRYKTWIAAQNIDNNLIVTANFENKTDKDIYVSYLLVSNKSGKAGSSNTTQKGTVEVKSNESSVLSEIKVNLYEKDSYEFNLRTYNGDIIIGIDKLSKNIK